MSNLSRLIRSHPIATLMLLAYITLAVAFSIMNPLHEATDEVRHYRYVRSIADLRQLPVQSGEQGNSQAHHPPLYYTTAALMSGWVRVSDPLYEPLINPHWAFRSFEVSTDNKNQYLHGPDEAWPYRDAALAAHIARWVTVLWGAGAVLLTILIARTVFPDVPAISIGAAALIAFCPMYAYLSGAINNDVPAALAGAAITYACLLTIRDGLTHRKAVVLGVLFGLANLVKFNLIAFYGVIEIALILALLAEANRSAVWRRLLIANGIILVVSAVLCGWWYIRNTMLYGEPTGVIRLTEIWGYREPTEGVALSLTELGYAWTSLWARFGYGQIPVPTIFYLITGALSILGIIGLVVFVLRSPLALKQRYMLLTLLSAVVISFLVLYIYLVIQPAGAMGRFVFPGLPAFAVLIASGLIAPFPRTVSRPLSAALSLGMLAYVLATMLGYLMPAYAIPAQAQAPAESRDLAFGDYARILDYSISQSEVRPGDILDVTVTWEILKPTAEPYAVFIQLLSRIDGAYIDIAQRDTYTGLGNYPSHWWKPGHIFTETYRVFLPETVSSPDTVLVQLGLYHPSLGRIPATSGDHVDFDEITVAATPDEAYPNELYVNWDDKFALLGYKTHVRVLYPGDRFTVSLYWQSLNPPKDEDFKVFLHLMQGETQLAGRDGNPVWADGFTSQFWVAGEFYQDDREVFLPADIAPGVYSLQLGWFSDTDGARLPIIAEDGHIVGDWLALPGIRIIERP